VLQTGRILESCVARARAEEFGAGEAASLPGILSATAVTDGAFLATGFFPGFIENTAGTISFIADSLAGPVPGLSGSGTLATGALAVGRAVHRALEMNFRQKLSSRRDRRGLTRTVIFRKRIRFAQPLPVQILDLMPRDAEQPRTQRAFASKAADPLPRCQEDLLHDVIGCSVRGTRRRRT
jgi:hypothetical protein